MILHFNTHYCPYLHTIMIMLMQREKCIQGSRRDWDSPLKGTCVSQCVLVSPSEGKGSGNTSPPKSQTPEEAKRPDTLLGCFERRDHLKKANTLPSTVTGKSFHIHNCLSSHFPKIRSDS